MNTGVNIYNKIVSMIEKYGNKRITVCIGNDYFSSYNVARLGDIDIYDGQINVDAQDFDFHIGLSSNSYIEDFEERFVIYTHDVEIEISII